MGRNGKKTRAPRRTGGAAPAAAARQTGEAAPSAAAPHTRARRWLPILLLALVSVGLFADTLDAGFLYDDQARVAHDASVQEGTLHTTSRMGMVGRVVRNATLLVDRALFGVEPTGYHLHNLLWHAASVSLLYLLLLRLLGGPGLAFAAALLFAILPAHVEAVASITNRKEMLCLSFSLLALLAYLRFLDARRLVWLAAAALAYLLAIGSKQVGAILPVVAITIEWLFVPAERRFALSRPRLLAGLTVAGGALLVGFLLARLDFSDLRSIGTLGGYEGEPSFGAFVLTSPRAFFHYLGLLVWPGGLCADHRIVLSRSLAEPVTALAWLGFAGYLALAVAVARRDRVLGFGLLWFAIHFVPISNWLPVSYVLADRYLYIPAVGFCVVLARGGELAVRALAPRLRLAPRLAAAALLGAAALALGVATLAQLRHWESNRALWTHTLACSPDSWRANLGLADELMRAGELRAALPLFERSIDLVPNRIAPWLGRGQVRAALGDRRGALADYERAAEMRPDLAAPHYNVGLLRFEMRDWPRSLAALGRALEIDPDFAAVYNTRAMVLERLRRFDDAHDNFEHAVSLDPKLIPALLNLGFSHERRGEIQAARRLYDRARRLGSPHGRAELERLENELSG